MWVAAIQLNSTPDLEANLARAQALVEEAAARGARLVALPEHFACLGSAADTAAAAQPVDGPLVTRFRELAGKLGIFLLLGSFPERTPGKARPYNTSLLLGPRGKILAQLPQAAPVRRGFARRPALPGVGVHPPGR